VISLGGHVDRATHDEVLLSSNKAAAKLLSSKKSFIVGDLHDITKNESTCYKALQGPVSHTLQGLVRLTRPYGEEGLVRAYKAIEAVEALENAL